MEVDTLPDIENNLVKRGVSRARAKSLAARFPEEHIRSKLEEFDYRMSREEGHPLRPKNPGGYLSQAIEEDYASPKGFKSKADLERERLEKDAAIQQRKAERAAKAAKEEAKKASAELEFNRKKDLVNSYLNGLSPSGRAKLESEALASSLFGGDPSDIIRESVIFNYVMEQGLVAVDGKK